MNNNCKSEQETYEFLKDALLLVYYNKNSFINKGFGNNTFKREISFEGISLDIKKSTTQYYQLHTTEVITKDSYFLSTPTHKVIESLKLDRLIEDTFYPYKHASIKITLNLDKQIIER
jgi:hypothetical protein